MTRIRFSSVLLSTVVLAACSKDSVQTIAAPSTGGAYVKFYNFAVNAPVVNFFANDAKLTAISSTSCTPPVDARCTSTGIESTTGTAYGSLGNAGLYSALAPAQYSFSGRIARTIVETRHHSPVETAQQSANVMTRIRRSIRSVRCSWLSSRPKHGY